METPTHSHLTRIPDFIYGTAWKEERTSSLVSSAIASGFRSFDTANQRKHYFEEGLGNALLSCYENSDLRRSNFFLQTKFTYQRGQDHRLPYDPRASLTEQVEQSFQSSLKHLHCEYLDSYVLHGPSQPKTLSTDDLEVWKAMESLYDQKLTRSLAVSNVSLDQLRSLFDTSRVKPTFVQNRCFSVNGWDFEIRKFCRENKIHYQGFSLLTANSEALRTPLVAKLSQKYGATIPQIIFRFTQQLSMIPLTGTSSPSHMAEDLTCQKFTLNENELTDIEKVML